jgi:hypothetical protein
MKKWIGSAGVLVSRREFGASRTSLGSTGAFNRQFQPRFFRGLKVPSPSLLSPE